MLTDGAGRSELVGTVLQNAHEQFLSEVYEACALTNDQEIIQCTWR